MKSTLIKVCASVLAIMMCVVCFAACGSKDTGDTTTTPAPTTTTPAPDTTTEAPATETTTEAPKTETTTTTTEATTTEPEPTTAAPAEGLIVYYEDFNSYANSTDTEAVLKALKWTRLTKEANGVYNETDGYFAFEDGRLYFDNYDTKEEKDAVTAAGGTNRTTKDGYYQIDLLNDEYMKPVVAGKYTLQYDVEYTDAGDNQRYALFVTECSPDGQCYNSFHFRIRGKADHQCHFYGSWKTFSAVDLVADVNPAADAADGSEGTPILQKLLGKDWATYGAEYNFTNVPVTIKLQWNPEEGHYVYMKKTSDADFIQVSAPSVNADGMMYIGWDGWSVQFKFGATIDGYMDNICLWTGWGEKPVGTTVTYKPAA